MRVLTQYLKALADPTRLRLVLALQDGELCVCQLNTLFPVSPSTLSRHLAVLERAGLLRSRKYGRWVYFSLPRRGLPPAARQLLSWAARHAAQDPQAQLDARALRACRRARNVPQCPSAN
jgi:DNA-binding transcriptional ArsR family regulator